jgi:hypothetical protein
VLSPRRVWVGAAGNARGVIFDFLDGVAPGKTEPLRPSLANGVAYPQRPIIQVEAVDIRTQVRTAHRKKAKGRYESIAKLDREQSAPFAFSHHLGDFAGQE